MVFDMTSKVYTRSEKGLYWSWFVSVFPVDERIGPEEVDSGSFNGCAKGDFLEPPDSKVFDSGFSVELGEGGFDS